MGKNSRDARATNAIVDHAHWHALPIGISGFERMLKDFAYVDKTLAIADLIAHGGTTILCRPRLFGKTLFISMLQCFFEKSVEGFIAERRQLFDDLAIGSLGERFTKHCGIHPVIRLDLAGIEAPTWNGTLALLRTRIALEYERHRYVLGSGTMSEIAEARYRRIMAQEEAEFETIDSLQQLVRVLYEYHGEHAVVLIDDYNSLLAPELTEKCASTAQGFVRSWLTSALDGTSSIMLAILTCTQPLQYGSDTPLPSHATIDTPLHSYLGTAFGFTMEEAEALAKHVGKRACLEEAQRWYQGYTIGESKVICPWSLLNYLREEVAQPYWTCADVNPLVRQLVLHADDVVETDLRVLAAGKSILHPLDPYQNQHDDDQGNTPPWTRLYLAGYLTTDDTHMPTETSIERRLRIPNLEVARLYQRELLFRASWIAGSHERLHRIHHALTKADCLTLEHELNGALRTSAGLTDINHRSQYRLCMLAMLYGIKGYRLPKLADTPSHANTGIIVQPDHEHGGCLPVLVIDVQRLRHADTTSHGRHELRKHAEDVFLSMARSHQRKDSAQHGGTITWGISFSRRQAACACHSEP